MRSTRDMRERIKTTTTHVKEGGRLKQEREGGSNNARRPASGSKHARVS